MAYTTPVAGDSTTTTATAVDTNFKEAGTGLYHYAADSGSANALTVTLSPAITAYTTGIIVRTLVSAANTGATTINVNGLGTKTIKKEINGSLYDLSAGDLAASQAIALQYDGTYFQLLTPIAIPTVPFFHIGDVGVGSATAPSSTNQYLRHYQACTDSTGNHLYIGKLTGTTPNINLYIYHFARDPRTGMYYYDGVSGQLQQPSSNEIGSNGNDTTNAFGLCAGSTYVWVATIANGNANIAIYRFSLALASKTTMTVSGTALTSVAFMGGNDSALYIGQDYSTSTSVIPYSISGTTATRGTSFTVADQGQYRQGMTFDGTYLYYMVRNNSNNIKKYNTSGTLQSTTTYSFFGSDTNFGWGCGIGFRQSGELYLIEAYRPGASSSTGDPQFKGYSITKP